MPFRVHTAWPAAGNRWGSPDPRLLVMYLNLQGQEYAFVAVYIPSGQFYEQCRLRADVYDKATLLHRRLCDTKPWCLQIWGRRFTPVVIALLRQELRTPDADDSVRHRTTPPHRARQRLPPTTPWEIYTDGSCEVAVARGRCKPAGWGIAMQCSKAHGTRFTGQFF